MLKKIVFILISVFIFNVNALTKNEFIDVIKKSPGFVKIALQLGVANQQLKVNQGGQDWVLGFGVNQLEKTNTENALFQTFTKNTHRLSSSLSKNIYETGGDLVVSYNQNKNSYVNKANDYDDNYLKVSYNQPLLKNAFGVVDNSNIDLSKYEVQIAKYKVLNEQQNFITVKLKQFFNWLKYQEQLKIYQTQLSLAKDLLQRTEKKYKSGLVNEVDVFSQKDLVLLREQNVLNIKQQLFQVRQNLSQSLNDKSLLTQNIVFDLTQFKKGKKHIFKFNSKTQIFKLAIEQQKRNIKTIKSEQQAKLDLKLSAKNYDKKNKTNNATSAEYEVGLQYSYILGGKSKDAKLEKALLSLKQQQLTLQITHNNEMASVVNLRENSNTLKNLAKLAKLRLITAQKKSKQQQKRYERAQIDISVVSSALNNEQKVALELLNYQIQYQNNYNDYLKTLDLLK